MCKIVSEENVKNIKNAYSKRESNGIFLPSVFVVEITNECFLNCIMCPRSQLLPSEVGHMDIEYFQFIMKGISGVAEHLMLYFMGEPLMHPNLDKIIAIARHHIKGKISISTNALNLSEDKINTILDCPLDLIICCIDHWSKEEYEKIRIGANFEKVIQNVSNLLTKRGKRKKPLIIVKSLDFGMPNADKKEFESFWKKRGAFPLIGWVDTWAGQLTKLKKYIPHQPYSSMPRKPCADLWFKMIINWRGEVILCCHNYNYTVKLGKIFIGDESFLINIWQGATISSLRDSHITGEYSKGIICRNCTEWADISELDQYVNLSKENINLVF